MFFSRFESTDFFVKQFLLWKVKKLNFESSVEILKELISLYKIYQLYCCSLHAWSRPTNWGQYLYNFTLTELSKSSVFAVFWREKPTPPPSRRRPFSLYYSWGIFCKAAMKSQKRQTLQIIIFEESPLRRIFKTVFGTKFLLQNSTDNNYKIKKRKKALNSNFSKQTICFRFRLWLSA